MSDYVIMVDSTSDLPPAMIQELEVEMAPLSFSCGGKFYRQYDEKNDLAGAGFFQLLRDGETATTVQITPAEYIDKLEPHLKAGRDVLLLVFSSQLSGTYQSSVVATAELNERYPDNKVISIDSKSAAAGFAMLTYYTVQQKRAGKTIDELADWVRDARSHNCHWVTVSDLNHLKRGGRLSSASALFGTLLNVKPIIIMDDDGCLVPVSKVRGRAQSLDRLVDEMEKTFDATLGTKVYIAHADVQADAEYLRDQVKTRIGVQESDITIDYLGPVIGAHTGPGCIALFFMGRQRTSPQA